MRSIQIVLLSLISIGALANSAFSADSTISLSVVAEDPATMVDVRCTVTERGVERTETLTGTTPMEFEFAASAIQCTIDADGAVVVEARRPNGSVSRSETSGGQVIIGMSGG